MQCNAIQCNAMYACICVHMSVCMHVCLSVCLSVCLYVCMFFSPYIASDVWRSQWSVRRPANAYSPALWRSPDWGGPMCYWYPMTLKCAIRLIVCTLSASFMPISPSSSSASRPPGSCTASHIVVIVSFAQFCLGCPVLLVGLIQGKGMFCRTVQAFSGSASVCLNMCVSNFTPCSW